jgi:hypothetical protein
MIIRVERVSKKILRASTFIVIDMNRSPINPVVISFFSGYHRQGIKFNTYTTTKYTKENCNKVLKFVEREIN